MPRKNTGRSGYDASANTQTDPAEHSLHGYTQPAGGMHGYPAFNQSGTSHDAVARRAFEIYERSGCKPGRCAQNWAQAEHDLSIQTKGGA